MDASVAQSTLMTPAVSFGWCIPLTLYLALVLLLQRRFGARVQIAFLAVIAILLPGMICVLWEGVFFVSPFLFSVLLTWLLVATVPFFSHFRS